MSRLFKAIEEAKEEEIPRMPTPPLFEEWDSAFPVPRMDFEAPQRPSSARMLGDELKCNTEVDMSVPLPLPDC